jgi:hypothetical protein
LQVSGVLCVKDYTSRCELEYSYEIEIIVNKTSAMQYIVRLEDITEEEMAFLKTVRNNFPASIARMMNEQFDFEYSTELISRIKKKSKKIFLETGKT